MFTKDFPELHPGCYRLRLKRCNEEPTSFDLIWRLDKYTVELETGEEHQFWDIQLPSYSGQALRLSVEVCNSMKCDPA